jgi:hypothetical protein
MDKMRQQDDNRASFQEKLSQVSYCLESTISHEVMERFSGKHVLCE